MSVQASELGVADIAIGRDSCAERFGSCCPDRAVSPRWLIIIISRGVVRWPCSAPLSVSPRRRSGLSPLCRPAHAARRAEPPIISGLPAVRGAKMFADAPTDSLIARLSGSDRLLHPKPGNVQRGKKDQRQHGRDQQSTHDRVGHRSPKYRGCATNAGIVSFFICAASVWDPSRGPADRLRIAISCYRCFTTLMYISRHSCRV